MKKLVFVDACVLIAAARGTGQVSGRAVRELDDPAAEFASSIFVKLEVLPKPLYHKKDDEAEFYRRFFDSVSVWAEPRQELLEAALAEAMAAGLSALDALHVACAAAVHADELLTSEGPTRAIHRTSLVPVRSIHPAAAPTTTAG